MMMHGGGDDDDDDDNKNNNDDDDDNDNNNNNNDNDPNYSYTHPSAHTYKRCHDVRCSRNFADPKVAEFHAAAAAGVKG